MYVLFCGSMCMSAEPGAMQSLMLVGWTGAISKSYS